MSQLQDLVRYLTSSGYALHPDGDGTYMLYTEDGTAVLKHWTGDSFDREELVTTSVRPGSAAAYIPSPDGSIIAYITDSSTVAVIRYDEDEEDWVEMDNLPQCQVHSDSQLAASLDPSGTITVVFQSDAGRLVCLQDSDSDESWSVAEITATQKPALGTALSIYLDPDSIALHVFYASSDDGAVYSVSRGHGDALWVDAVALAITKGALRRMLITKAPEKAAYTVYALTRTDSLLQLAADEAPRDLGHIGKDGTFTPSTTAECCIQIFGLEVSIGFQLSVSVASKRRKFFR